MSRRLVSIARFVVAFGVAFVAARLTAPQPTAAVIILPPLPGPALVPALPPSVPSRPSRPSLSSPPTSSPPVKERPLPAGGGMRWSVTATGIPGPAPIELIEAENQAAIERYERELAAGRALLEQPTSRALDIEGVPPPWPHSEAQERELVTNEVKAFLSQYGATGHLAGLDCAEYPCIATIVVDGPVLDYQGGTTVLTDTSLRPLMHEVTHSDSTSHEVRQSWASPETTSVARHNLALRVETRRRAKDAGAVGSLISAPARAEH